jgi:hypothetical protein
VLAVGFAASFDLIGRAIKVTFTEDRTQDTFFKAMAYLPISSQPKLTAVFAAVFISCLVSVLKESSSPRHQPKTDFRSFGLCSCNILGQTNNCGVGDVFLPFSVSKLRKFSPVHKPRTFFQVSRSNIPI